MSFLKGVFLESMANIMKLFVHIHAFLKLNILKVQLLANSNTQMTVVGNTCQVPVMCLAKCLLCAWHCAKHFAHVDASHKFPCGITARFILIFRDEKLRCREGICLHEVTQIMRGGSDMCSQAIHPQSSASPPYFPASLVGGGAGPK